MYVTVCVYIYIYIATAMSQLLPRHAGKACDDPTDCRSAFV